MRYLAMVLPFVVVLGGLGALLYYGMTYKRPYVEEPYRRPTRQCVDSAIKPANVVLSDSGLPVLTWRSAEQKDATYFIFRRYAQGGRWEQIGNAPAATPGLAITFTAKRPPGPYEYDYGVQTMYCQDLKEGQPVVVP
jgi:hypothetical protein